MHKKSSCDELPNNFKEAINGNGSCRFDPDTLERFVTTAKNNNTLQTYESGINKLTVRFPKGHTFVNSFGYTFCTSEYIKQTTDEVYNSEGNRIAKASLDTDLTYYMSDDKKLYGLETSNLYNREVILTSHMGSDIIRFDNKEVNHYKTPDTKVRKERRNEIKALKAKYILEHTICPKDNVPDHFNALNPSTWKQVLEDTEHMQLHFIKDNKTSWYMKKLHDLIDEYTDVYIYNPTEYITWK
jgi:hypothetical protein